MIHVITTVEEDKFGITRLVVSHGVDEDGVSVVLPPDHPEDLGAVQDPLLGWIIRE